MKEKDICLNTASAVDVNLSLFYRKKEKQKKLAAADKYAKIMILSLNKKNSLRSDSFLFLTLQHHNFLTRFLQGGRFDSITKI